MNRGGSQSLPDPWVVVLAGGDGRRLLGAMVCGQRVDRPKQFCRFCGAASLLEQTVQRAERLADRSRIVAVVREDQRSWWTSELSRLSPENVLVQHDNRGTAVAILHAVVHVLRRDPAATLVILPSDHAVDSETVLIESVGLAARMATLSGEHFILLGASPGHAETTYGWILPNSEVTGIGRKVERFVEKPEPRLAAELFAAGAVWNTFVSASSGRVLLGLFERHQPMLLGGYRRFLAAHVADQPTLYRGLPYVDFGRDIMESAVGRLRVVTVPPCGWTDLGTPERLNQWLGRGCVPPPACEPNLGEELTPAP